MDTQIYVRRTTAQVHRTGTHINLTDVRSWERAGAHRGVCAHCKSWARLGLDTCYIYNGINGPELKVCHT